MKRCNKIIIAAIVAVITFTACDMNDAVLVETTTTVTESAIVTTEASVETSEETSETSETSFEASESEVLEEDDDTSVANEISTVANSTPKPTEITKTTAAPKPTKTTKQTATPKLTETPKPTETLKPTESGNTDYGTSSSPSASSENNDSSFIDPTTTPALTSTPSPTPKPAVAAIIRVKFRVSGCNITENIGTASEDGEAVQMTVVREYKCKPLPGTKYHSCRVSDYEPYGLQVVPDDLYKDFYAKYPNGVVWGYGTGYENGHLVGPKVVGFVDE